MKVAYTALDQTGHEVVETMEAPDVRSAVDSLRKRNLFVTQISEHTGKERYGDSHASKHEESPVGTLGKVKLPIKQLALFTRQMAMMLTSGSGVVPSLNSIARQIPNPLHAKLIGQVARDLEEGSTLSEALRKFPRTFDPNYCAVIAAGESSGTLTEMFNRLSTIVGKRRAMRNKVLGAMAYPALLIALSTSIVMVLLMFVMPRFGEMFTTLSVPLPASTKFLISVGEATRSYWPAILAGAVVLVGSTLGTVLMPGVRLWISGASMHVPLVSRVITGLIQGETFRLLGMLVEAHIGLLDAIQLVKGVTLNRRFQELYQSMEAEVTEGGSISRALETSRLVSPPICQAIRTGEENGALGAAMSYVANVLDEDNTELVNTMTKLLEPMILIIMGVVVGGVAVSLFLPMFDMTSAIK